jgi:uncharacterized membrane protein YciS (DUF1049 family)
MTFLKSFARIVKKIIAWSALIFFITFLINNRQAVIIQFFPLPFEIQTRLFLVIIFSFSFGLLFGAIVFSKNIFNHILTNFRNRRKIKALENKSIGKSK